MDSKQWNKIYKKVYRIIGNKTPLYGDCGLLCQRACCQGDSDDGMLLFPGEDVIYKNKPVSPYFSLSPVSVGKGIKGIFAVCDGTCDRKYRPLACRIFPYLPILDQNQTIEIIKDPRASICPLVHIENEDAHGVMDPTFIDSLYEAFDYLLQFEGIPEFLDAVYHNAKEVKVVRDLFLNKGK